MKVDIDSLDSAYFKLRDLQQRLEDVACQMHEVIQVLGQYYFGGSAKTDLITNSLKGQISILECRSDSLNHLAEVIQEAMEAYQGCETLNRHQVDNGSAFMINGKVNILPNSVRYVQPIREKEIITQYIMPLITTGK